MTWLFLILGIVAVCLLVLTCLAVQRIDKRLRRYELYTFGISDDGPENDTSPLDAILRQRGIKAQESGDQIFGRMIAEECSRAPSGNPNPEPPAGSSR